MNLSNYILRIISITGLLIGGACQEIEDSPTPKAKISSNQQIIDQDLIKIAERTLLLSKNIEFRKTVFEEVNKQFDGDYNVLLTTLFETDDLKKEKAPGGRFYFSEKDLDKVDIQKDFVQIYIPHFTENTNKKISSTFDNDIIIVFQESDESIAEVPGYFLNTNNRLEKLNFLISEEFVKNNEVWVIGFNERMDLDDYVSIDRKSTALNRIEGKAEYIHKIMIPDLNGIEHWTSGKIELVARVATQGSGDALKYDYGKIKRSGLKNKKWMTIDTFIAYWNKNTIGDYIKVHWTELDGGERDVVTISLTMPKSESIPFDTKVEFKLRKLDDDLGHQIVQFSDPDARKYSTGLIEWHMKSN